MATLRILVEERRELVRVTVPLGRGDQHGRLLYGFKEFVHWLEYEVPALDRGRLNAADPPNEQIHVLIGTWISGRRVHYNRMFKDLQPMADEVWEMKTADLRVFGWLYRPRQFIAVFGDYADHYKGRNPRKSYEDAKRRVLAARSHLDLDEPKYTGGTFDELV